VSVAVKAVPAVGLVVDSADQVKLVSVEG